MSDQIKVEVTQEHIDRTIELYLEKLGRGENYSACCPISLALKDFGFLRAVTVNDFCKVVYHGGYEEIWRHDASDFVQEIDDYIDGLDSHKPKPRTVTLW